MASAHWRRSKTGKANWFPETETRLADSQNLPLGSPNTFAAEIDRLIDDFIDLAGIQGGTFSIVSSPCRLTDAVMPAIERISPQAEAKGGDAIDKLTTTHAVRFPSMKFRAFALTFKPLKVLNTMDTKPPR